MACLKQAAVMRPPVYRSVMRRAGSILLEVWLPVALIAAWWIASAGSESFYFPPLADILARFSELWLFSAVPEFLAPSLANLAFGFLVAVLVGVTLGVVFGLFERLYSACWLLFEIARSTPMIILVPMAIMFFGVGSTEKVVLIAFASVWPILLNTTDGVREVDPLIRDITRSFSMGRATQIFRVLLPAASPQILAGTRLGVSIAIMMMVGSELFASVNGIGYFVLRTQETAAVTDMWTAVILLGLLGYIFNTGYALIEHVLLKWHRGLRATESSHARGR